MVAFHLSIFGHSPTGRLSTSYCRSLARLCSATGSPHNRSEWALIGPLQLRHHVTYFSKNYGAETLRTPEMEKACRKHQNGQIWRPWHIRMRFYDGLNFEKANKICMEKVAGEQETNLRKADRTVGVNCYIFSNISSGTAWLLQGMFATEKRRYNFNSQDKSLIKSGPLK